ncbi:NADPH-dependent FMN reductase [Streptomyces griseorubiginosus]|uniref:NADPH-dependent FMN reductase n=1 Tax=Streptomyces griseorubiginosus TaxID=67304 RepID=UPI000AC33AA2|nr:NAD(P)H-dependent oxidoreductase [Streptomyces griseorubiginosus]
MTALTDRSLVQVLIASTRPNRAGEPTARWVAEQAATGGVFDIEVVDLAKVNLPMLAEPGHPSERNYQLPSTRAFSEVIDRARRHRFS